jgi:lipoate-protein ligase A
MKFLTNPCTNAHWNMAFDEFALEGLDVQEPLFYLWQNAPAVIIGLNQSPYAEVNLPYLEEKGILLARRVTGGGAVYHDLGNLNYSIVGPVRDMEEAFEIMPAALCKLGVPAERSGRNDILVEGRKCSGYAKRLRRDRMMIHGTLMWDVDLDVLTEALKVPGSKVSAKGIASVRSRVANLKDYLPQYPTLKAFQAALQDLLADGDAEYPLTAAQQEAVDREAREKFGTWEWNFGHSPETTHRGKKKFACGTVEVLYSLKGGELADVTFQGDFLGNRPAEELAAQLKGKRLQELGTLDVSAYFDGLDGTLFATLFEA